MSRPQDAIADALRGNVPALRRLGITLTKGEARRCRWWLRLHRVLRSRRCLVRAQRIVVNGVVSRGFGS